MIVDHIGIVVRSLKGGMEKWEKLFGYKQASDIVTNTRQKVKVVFLSKDDSMLIKLIEPSSDDSPVYAFARKGGGLHHLCFRCDDIATGVADLEKKGARCIVPPQPGEAFENNDIAFLFVGNGTNIELIDTILKKGLK